MLTEDLGLVPGQRVLLRSPNNPWTVAAWLGVLKAGGVVVTTMAALRARELAPIVERTQPSVALVDHRFAEDARAVRRHRRCRRLTVIAYGGAGAGRPDRPRPPPSRATFSNVATAADDVALLAPTSGSTGVPKITMHFHRDILSIDNTFGRHVLRLAPDDVVACTAPLAFTFGLGMLVVFPLRAGACALLVEQATPAQLADLVASEQVTVLATAPTAYKAILRDGLEHKLAGLRTAVSRRGAHPAGHLGAPARRASACGSSTASAPPRCCTSSSPPSATTSGPGRPASRCRASAAPSSGRTAPSSAPANRDGSA